MSALITPIGNLSVFNAPRGLSLMGAFKVYVDESGDAADPQHSVIAMAGYVSDLDHWGLFEREWADVLDCYAVPYLHMKGVVEQGRDL